MLGFSGVINNYNYLPQIGTYCAFQLRATYSFWATHELRLGIKNLISEYTNCVHFCLNDYMYDDRTLKHIIILNMKVVN